MKRYQEKLQLYRSEQENQKMENQKKSSLYQQEEIINSLHGL